jgi:hypothetical protein
LCSKTGESLTYGTGQTLTIGKRTGSFKGMLATRTFNVKVIGGKETTVTYSGKAINVK